MNDAIEVEAVPSQALTVHTKESNAIVAASSVLDMEPSQFNAGLDRRKANRASLMEWVRSALVEGTDFGRISTKRGPSKPSLWKPGAEKICGMLGVIVTFPNLKDYEQSALNGVKLENIILRCDITGSGGGIVASGVGARSLSQDSGDLNKCLKMAEKSAHIDATLRMAGLSEVFTQDLEDMAKTRQGDHLHPSKPESAPSRPKIEPLSHPSPPPKTPPSPPQMPTKAIPFPTEESRTKMIAALKARLGEPNREIVSEYFRKLADPTPLAPFEQLEELKLIYVPATAGQMKALSQKLTEFGNGDRAAWAFPPHPEPSNPPPPAVTTPSQVAPKVMPGGPLWWRNIIISLPRKGMTRRDYAKNPDTIGALYDLRHGNDEEAASARKRLFGLVQWKPEPREFKGKIYEPTDADWTTYKALQAFWEYFQREHPGEKL